LTKQKNWFKQVEINSIFFSFRSKNEILDETSADNAGQDNRDLCDDGIANQTLQQEEIQQLKSEGASGQAIISQLVSKSATFEKKTAYSQQKYLNKKKKKYIQIYRAWKPSIRLLCQAYTHDLQKIM